VSVSKQKKIWRRNFENKISTQSICSNMRTRRNDDEEYTIKLVLGVIIAEQMEKLMTQHF